MSNWSWRIENSEASPSQRRHSQQKRQKPKPNKPTKNRKEQLLNLPARMLAPKLFSMRFVQHALLQLRIMTPLGCDEHRSDDAISFITLAEKHSGRRVHSPNIFGSYGIPKEAGRVTTISGKHKNQKTARKRNSGTYAPLQGEKTKRRISEELTV